LIEGTWNPKAESQDTILKSKLTLLLRFYSLKQNFNYTKNHPRRNPNDPPNKNAEWHLNRKSGEQATGEGHGRATWNGPTVPLLWHGGGLPSSRFCLLLPVFAFFCPFLSVFTLFMAFCSIRSYFLQNIHKTTKILKFKSLYELKVGERGTWNTTIYRLTNTATAIFCSSSSKIK